ncbi:MAG: hypothetical protein MSC31_07385 [Solirubrobacteraceae bacterium MAG38_C4-C5]|nr:hypothetical protein [Candidatus Siliceabacter maunaloa]
MTLHRGIDGSEPVRTDPVGRVAGVEEERRLAHTSRLTAGTLACPGCDAPVALTDGPLTPRDPLACSFCGHAGAVREFLTLGEPSRHTHVEVRVVSPAR